MREITYAPRKFYVREDGSDGNNGLVDSPSGAFQTPGAAIRASQWIDTFGNTVEIVFRATTAPRTEPIYVPGPMVGGGALLLTGDISNPNVEFTTTTTAITATNNSKVTVRGFKLQTSGPASNCIQADSGAEIVQGNNDFGQCGSMHLDLGPGGRILGIWPYTISGGGKGHWHAGVPGLIDISGVTVTILNTPTLSAYFAGCSTSKIRFYGVNFVGTFIGTRHFVHSNGVIESGGGDRYKIPGTVEGIEQTGGQFV